MRKLGSSSLLMIEFVVLKKWWLVSFLIWFYLNLKTEWSGGMRKLDPGGYHVMFRDQDWCAGCVVCTKILSSGPKHAFPPASRLHLLLAQWLHLSPECTCVIFARFFTWIFFYSSLGAHLITCQWRALIIHFTAWKHLVLGMNQWKGWWQSLSLGDNCLT